MYFFYFFTIVINMRDNERMVRKMLASIEGKAASDELVTILDALPDGVIKINSEEIIYMNLVMRGLLSTSSLSSQN